MKMISFKNTMGKTKVTKIINIQTTYKFDYLIQKKTCETSTQDNDCVLVCVEYSDTQNVPLVANERVFNNIDQEIYVKS